MKKKRQEEIKEAGRRRRKEGEREKKERERKVRSGRKDEEREKKEKGREIARCFCFWPEDRNVRRRSSLRMRLFAVTLSGLNTGL